MCVLTTEVLKQYLRVSCRGQCSICLHPPVQCVQTVQTVFDVVLALYCSTIHWNSNDENGVIVLDL